MDSVPGLGRPYNNRIPFPASAAPIKTHRPRAVKERTRPRAGRIPPPIRAKFTLGLGPKFGEKFTWSLEVLLYGGPHAPHRAWGHRAGDPSLLSALGLALTGFLYEEASPVRTPLRDAQRSTASHNLYLQTREAAETAMGICAVAVWTKTRAR